MLFILANQSASASSIIRSIRPHTVLTCFIEKYAQTSFTQLMSPMKQTDSLCPALLQRKPLGPWSKGEETDTRGDVFTFRSRFRSSRIKIHLLSSRHLVKNRLQIIEVYMGEALTMSNCAGAGCEPEGRAPPPPAALAPP